MDMEEIVEEITDVIGEKALDTSLSQETSVEILEEVIGFCRGWITTIRADMQS